MAASSELESKKVDTMTSEERDTGAAEATVEMKFTRKRKKEEKMETDHNAAKKPNFPAIVPDSDVVSLSFHILLTQQSWCFCVLMSLQYGFLTWTWELGLQNNYRNNQSGQDKKQQEHSVQHLKNDF